MPMPRKKCTGNYISLFRAANSKSTPAAPWPSLVPDLGALCLDGFSGFIFVGFAGKNPRKYFVNILQLPG
jgi:hypothetical protein